MKDFFAKLVAIFIGIYTNLRSMVMVASHTFRKRDTIQYPEVKPYVPPRYRLPGGLHLATEGRAGRRPLVPGVLPHQLLALHFLRPVRGSLPNQRDPDDAGLRAGRVPPPGPGIREGAPADQRYRQVSGLQL